MHETIQTRRNPAALSPQRQNKAAFGPFCDAVRRLACLTPSQKDFACLLAEATLLQGVTSLPFESLESLTDCGPGHRPFAGLGKNDLSLIINGGWRRKINSETGEESRKWVPGLVEFGIVVMDERGPLERGLRCTILTVMAEASQWSVPLYAWRYSAEEKVQWLANVAACRRAFTPQLEGLVEEADLLDARAAVAAEAAASGNLPPGNDDDAREVQTPTTAGACRAAVSGVDARGVRPERTRGVPLPGRSDSQNAELQAKARTVPTVGTPTRARALSPKTVSSKSALTLSVDELKSLIRSGRELDFVSAMQAIIPTHENGDGGKWRVRWRRDDLKPFVVSVFEMIIEDMTRGKYHATPGAKAEFYWRDFGGSAHQKKLEDS